jgi:hypothetical protein
MSEFTAGILFLKDGQSMVGNWITGKNLPHYLRSLNQKWSVLCLEDQYLSKPDTLSMMLELSKSLPLLHFQYAEEHGWGYKVFINGEQIADFDDDYAYEHRIVCEIVSEQYPEEKDIPSFLYFDDRGRGVLSKIEASPEYAERIWRRFSRKNLQSLSHFGIDDKTIKMLNELLTAKNLNREEPHDEEIKAFRQALSINEMYLMSYYHLHRPE